MLCSGLFWAHTVAVLCGVIANLNPSLRVFRNQMDDLNAFMRNEQMPPDMAQRLREYFHRLYPLRREQAYKKLFIDMSPALHREVVIWCNARWTQRVWFLHSTSDGFKFDISRALQIRLFAPKELVPTGELNIVHRGEAMYNGKVLTRGQTWGEDIILSSVKLRKSNPNPNPNPNPTPTPNQVKLRKSNSARAIQFLEVMQLSRERLVRIIANHPKDGTKIRSQALTPTRTRTLSLNPNLTFTHTNNPDPNPIPYRNPNPIPHRNRNPNPNPGPNPDPDRPSGSRSGAR